MTTEEYVLLQKLHKEIDEKARAITNFKYPDSEDDGSDSYYYAGVVFDNEKMEIELHRGNDCSWCEFSTHIDYLELTEEMLFDEEYLAKCREENEERKRIKEEKKKEEEEIKRLFNKKRAKDVEEAKYKEYLRMKEKYEK